MEQMLEQVGNALDDLDLEESVSVKACELKHKCKILTKQIY